MSKSCILRVRDQVNVKFEDLDPFVRRQLSEALAWDVPYARHTPQFKMGRWDGKKNFATTGGATFKNLLDKALPIIYDAGYDIDLIDERPPFEIEFPEIDENVIAHKCWPAGHPMEGEPIVLREHQVRGINTYFKNPQSLQEISTGAGKTIITATISYMVEPHGRTIIIVPSKSLVEQTEEDFINLGLDVGVYYGDRKEFGHKHTISTWQSLDVLAKNSRQGKAEITIEEFLKDIVCVQIDEAQSAKADVLKDLLCGAMAKIPLRWGMTGTIPLEEFNFIPLLVSIGPVVGVIGAKELQDLDVLSKCHVHVKQLDDSHTGFTVWDDERNYLTTDKTRLAWLAGLSREIAETGNTLILVNNIETGEFLQSMIPGSSFVYGGVKTKKRREEYKEIQDTDNKVIIATYGVAAVGINIPRIFNLMIFEAGASSIRVIQSIGRALRRAKDKDYADIYDICSSLKFSKRHLSKRKKYYDSAQYPYTIEKIKYR